MGPAAQQIFDNICRYVIPPQHRYAELALVDESVWPFVEASIKSLFTQTPHGLLLSGKVGCGKTSILAVVLKEYLQHRIECLMPEQLDQVAYAPGIIFDFWFCTHKGLIDNLRAMHPDDNTSEEARLLAPERILKPIHFIDDFGRGYEDKAGWSLSLEDEYFDNRWRMMLPTFVSTNLTPNELRRWPDMVRVVDRLGDNAWMKTVIVPGGSRRRERQVISNPMAALNER